MNGIHICNINIYTFGFGQLKLTSSKDTTLKKRVKNLLKIKNTRRNLQLSNTSNNGISQGRAILMYFETTNHYLSNKQGYEVLLTYQLFTKSNTYNPLYFRDVQSTSINKISMNKFKIYIKISKVVFLI